MDKLKKDNYIVLIPEGRIDSSNAHIFEQEISTEVDAFTGDVLISFEKIEYISSAGLRVLLVIFKKMKEVNRKLFIAGMNENIFKVFSSSGFSKILNIFQSLEEAYKAMWYLKSF